MSESIKAKADRLFGAVIGTTDFGPLLGAIASGEWTPEDARLMKAYSEGQEAERERCAKIADETAGNGARLSDWDHCAHIIAAKIRGTEQHFSLADRMDQFEAALRSKGDPFGTSIADIIKSQSDKIRSGQ